MKFNFLGVVFNALNPPIAPITSVKGPTIKVTTRVGIIQGRAHKPNGSPLFTLVK